jgi:hypothetical protein
MQDINCKRNGDVRYGRECIWELCISCSIICILQLLKEIKSIDPKNDDFYDVDDNS